MKKVEEFRDEVTGYYYKGYKNDNVSNTGSVVSVGTQTRDNYFYFNASSANPIYGASSHVQPKGTAFNVCIVYE